MNIFTKFRNYFQLFIAFFALLFSVENLPAQLCLGYEIRNDETTEDEVFLDVIVQELSGVAAMQFTLSYSPETYEFIGFVEANLPGFTEGSFRNEPNGVAGAITVAWFDVNGAGVNYEDEKPLFTLKMKKKSDDNAVFEFKDYPTPIEIAICEPNFGPCKVVYNFEDCTTGENLSPALSGQLFLDEDKDCEFDEGEANTTLTNNWQGWNILAEQDGQYSLSGNLQANGNYELKLFRGLNNIEVLLPSPFYATCQGSFTFDSEELDLNEVIKTPVQITDFCPYLEVNINSFPRNPCDDTFYFLEYTNKGTAAASDVYVEFDLDYRLKINEIDVPVVDLGDNRYRLDIGNLAIGERGNIFISATIPCDVSSQEVLRNEARIYPNEVCGTINENWSGASLKINGKCTSDKVIFEVENVGMGNMTEPLQYLVIEDAVIFKTAPIQLASGVKETITLNANGSSYFMQIPQENGHPGNYRPSAFVEACGRDENGNFSTGYANIFPEENNDVFVDVDYNFLSQEDKLMAVPIGYAEEHFIEPNNAIEYTLFFRNINTAITITDTLSTHLDITTFKPVAANQPYEYTLEDGVLLINVLPPAVSGDRDFNNFIKFSIQPKASLPLGTVIENKATLDYAGSEPEITNMVYHTLMENFLERTTSTEEKVIAPNQVSIAPNPSSDKVVFTIKNWESANYTIDITNLDGKIIQHSTFNNPTFQFHKNNLPSGTYLYRVVSDRGLVEHGFFVLVD